MQGESVAARIERGRISSEGAGSNPSPVPRRLEKAPSRATLSPRERAVSRTGFGSYTSGCVRIVGRIRFGWLTTVQHHPGARSATPPHLRRGVRRAPEVTPHPSRDGWKKRRRGPPSPLGRGLYHAGGALRRRHPDKRRPDVCATCGFGAWFVRLTNRSAPPRRSERHPSSSEEGSSRLSAGVVIPFNRLVTAASRQFFGKVLWLYYGSDDIFLFEGASELRMTTPDLSSLKIRDSARSGGSAAERFGACLRSAWECWCCLAAGCLLFATGCRPVEVAAARPANGPAGADPAERQRLRHAAAARDGGGKNHRPRHGRFL